MQPSLPLLHVRVMYWSPLALGVSGPAIAAQNWGVLVQVAPPTGVTMTLVLGPRASVGLEVEPAGSLPKVLHGLPIGAGPL